MAPNAEDTATTQRSALAAQLCAIDEQVRAALSDPEVAEAVWRPGLPLGEVMRTAMSGYADRPAIGERATEPVLDQETGRTTLRLLPRFETVTYAELWRRAVAIAAAWHHDARNPVRTGDLVATLGFTSGQHTTIDLACIRLGAVAVPLQAGATAGQLTPIVEETGPRVLATSFEHLDTAAAVAQECASVTWLVVFDHHPEVDDERESLEAVRARLAAAGSGLVVESLADLLDRGDTLPEPPAAPDDEDRLSLIVYTSGSTGSPKGAMYPARLVTELWRKYFPDRHGLPLLGIHFMPWSHLFAREMYFSTLAAGGTAYFTAKSDLSTLFEDIALIRPTELAAVPRIWDLVLERYRRDLAARTAAGDSVFDSAGSVFDRTVEDEVKADLRETFFGGRVLWAAYGGAPLSAELTNLVESVLRVPMQNIFGCTEGGILLADNKVLRDRVLDYRLEEVPELGYLSTDHPYPRGEFVVKATTLIPGYFKRPDITAEVFDADGYYHTGDIMAEVGPNELVYVDRSKNVLKLSQGEFVTVSRLEEAYIASPVIRQMYLYGSSERPYLLAVVVPTPEALERAGGDLDGVRALIGASVQQIAKDEDFQLYEIPRDFLVETEPFTVESGLLSAVRKPLRPKLKERYGAQLERFYVELADREASELDRLRGTGSDRPIVETVVAAARAVLGSTTGDLSPDVHFTDLGGDSLSALTFANLLRDIFDVEIAVGVIISPANDLRALAGLVDEQLTVGSDRPTATTVHGARPTELRAADLTLDKFVDADILSTASALPPPAESVRTVLITGANGYLGRFICLEWLARLARSGGTVVCVVRGSDAAAARARLDAAFATGDDALSRRYQELSEGHLEVLAGDIGQPALGLGEDVWRRLADTVDVIVHQAAMVNHVLSYEQLFGPNVVGTAELIRLAITARLKPVTYLSTVGMLTQDPPNSDEDADIRVINPVRPIDDSYASGYSNTKWAGEVLLREAHERFGLPVTSFRSSMILAHRRYAGQLNVPDVFTRLLVSLIATGIAPASFYRDAAAAHYDGLPVDFTANAITTLAVAKGYQTYNLVNPHDDGVSLDTVVGWLVAAGYSISRVDDYGEWFSRFETALRALPQERKQHSVLPLLHVFAAPDEPVGGSPFPAERFRAAVRDSGTGTDRDIPHITADLIQKYATDLALLGLL